MQNDPLRGFRFLIWFAVGGLVGLVILKALIG